LIKVSFLFNHKMSNDTDEKLIESDSSDLSLYSSINSLLPRTIHMELEKDNLCSNEGSDDLEERFYMHLRILDRIRKLKAFAENNPLPFTDYYCVLHFECTCATEKSGKTYSNEIIEFSSLFIHASTAKVLSRFHSYCRPVINPVLSEFCTRSTGIRQENVESAPLFPEVFKHFLQWIKIEKDGKSVAFVTDGNEDIAAYLQKQLLYFNLDIPKELRSWIDLKKAFSDILRVNLLKLSEMLDVIGLHFECTKHCGMDDAKNISRIVIWLSELKIFLQKNAKLSKNGKFSMKLSDNYNNFKTPPDDNGSSFSLKTEELPYLFTVKRSKYYARLRELSSTSDEDDEDD
ncbi:3'-5' exonuclease eri-1, partial [Trichinella spiralis]